MKGKGLYTNHLINVSHNPELEIASLLYRLGQWGLERLRDLLKTTLLLSGRAVINSRQLSSKAFAL